MALASAALLGVLPSGGAALAAPGTTGPAPAPPMTVGELRAEVARTGERLAQAVTRYEQSRSAVARLVQQQVSAERSAADLDRTADATQARVGSLAASLYRNPVDPALNAFLSGNLTSVSDYLHLTQSLDARGRGQAHDLATVRAQVTAAATATTARAFAATTAVSAGARLRHDLESLQSDALASQVRLASAVRQLALAQARARARAVARARAEAAAAGLRRLAALASPAPPFVLDGITTGGGPACSADAALQEINGFLPDSVLCPLAGAPGQRLTRAAASAFDLMSTAFRTSFRTPLCVTDSYRSFAGQVDVFRRKPTLAATPGRSKHGLGRAVDLCGGVQRYGTPPYLWLKANAQQFGFVHPDWAEPDGGRPEPWHWEFVL